MTRVKRGKIAAKRRKKLLKYSKGFRYGRKNKYRQAKEALLHAFNHSYKDRKRKKREARRLWTVQINAALKKEGISYHQFIKLLKDNQIKLDRKILAQLANDYPEAFLQIIKEIK